MQVSPSGYASAFTVPIAQLEHLPLSDLIRLRDRAVTVLEHRIEVLTSHLTDRLQTQCLIEEISTHGADLFVVYFLPISRHAKHVQVTVPLRALQTAPLDPSALRLSYTHV